MGGRGWVLPMAAVAVSVVLIVVGGWPAVATLAVVTAVAALVGGGQARRRAAVRRHRSDLIGADQGYWRGMTPEDELPWPERAWCTTFVYRAVPVTLSADERGLVFTPDPMAHRIIRLAPVRFGWDEVVDAMVAGDGRTRPDGTFSVLRLTTVTLRIVGPRVPEELHPMTDEETAEYGLTAAERADADSEAAEDIVELYGGDYLFGTAQLRFATTDATGLVEYVSRWASGVPPQLTP